MRKSNKSNKRKKYYEKYLNEGKDIYLVWIDFNKKERNVDDIKIEKIN